MITNMKYQGQPFDICYRSLILDLFFLKSDEQTEIFITLCHPSDVSVV